MLKSDQPIFLIFPLAFSLSLTLILTLTLSLTFSLTPTLTLSLGMPEHHAHRTGTRGDYNGVIAQLAGVDRLSPLYDNLFKYVLEKRKYHVMDYTKDNYKVNADGTWTSQLF